MTETVTALFCPILGILPEDINKLQKLEVLSLSGNSISCLPSTFKQLSHIKSLTLSRNQFTSFPHEVLNLMQLDMVDLSQNQIVDLPQDMSGLQAVEVNLNQNQVGIKNKLILFFFSDSFCYLSLKKKKNHVNIFLVIP